MKQYDKNIIGKQAKELGFIRDTFEKVCRLIDVLSYFHSDLILSNNLALKGGTAINLTIFNLPRLSVDIDLDYVSYTTKEEMLVERQIINERITKYMISSGYKLSDKSKQYHALDSFIFEYINAGEVKDNLKIEINYMLRNHIFPLVNEKINAPWLDNTLSVLCVNPIEIFASKTAALLNRGASRDLYDIYNMQKHYHLSKEEMELFKKCILFYIAISFKTIPLRIEFNKINDFSSYRIKTELLPVLRNGEKFDLNAAQENVIKYLKDNIILTDSELAFLDNFYNKIYCPELLFDDNEIINRIIDHPMALWKCNISKK